MGVATAEKRTAKARTQAHPANHAQQSPELLAATRESSIEESIRNLVAVRAAQLNGCTFCPNMHVKQAKMHGERDCACTILQAGVTRPCSPLVSVQPWRGRKS
jgi:AhpD family alkylhydroperoxidase